MIVLLDNGHGFDTPGKQSPDGFFREYAYNRFLTAEIHERLTVLGIDSRFLVPEREDIPLPERCRRANAICEQFGSDQVILLSLHINAAGNGQQWMNARGWSCYTTRGETRADALATCLYDAAKIHLPGMRLRTDYRDDDPDLEEGFYILRYSRCPAVLTENLFMDNRQDLAFLESRDGSKGIINLHVMGIVQFFTKEDKFPLFQ